MNQVMSKFQNSTFHNLYRSFSPASRAVLLFAIPFTLVDAIHYYTAGSALIFSLPLLGLIYLLCGALAAHYAHRDALDPAKLPGAGRSAGLRLWLTSTVINTLLAIILGITSLGLSLLGGAFYLCLFAPLHALGSALLGRLGGWAYQQYTLRTSTNE